MGLTARFVDQLPGAEASIPYYYRPPLLAGTSNAAANRQMIQGWHDDVLATRPSGVRAMLVVDPGTFWLDRPVSFWRSYIDVLGYGAGRSSLRGLAGHDGDVLRVGCPPAAAADPAHWVDLSGVVDNSFAATPSTRWGYDLRSDVKIVSDHCGYHRVAGADLTVEVLFRGSPPVGPLMGAAWGDRTDPWGVRVETGVARLLYATEDGSMIRGIQRSIDIPGFVPSLAAGAVHRVVFQFSMSGDRPPMTAWVDGVQTSTPADPSTLGFSLPGAFRTVNHAPFAVGALTATAASFAGSDFSAAGYLPWEIFGLRISHGIRYADDGLGTPIRRLDGATATDLNTFYQGDGITAMYLPCDEGPAASSATRRVPIMSPNGRTGALLLGAVNDDVNLIADGIRLRDLSLVGYGLGGSAMSVGMTLNFDATDVEFTGYDRGVSAWQWGPNYPMRFAGCEFSAAAGVPIHLHDAIATLDRPNIGAYGICCLWGVSSSLEVTGAFFGPGAPKAIYAGTHGSKAIWSRTVGDIEDRGGPTVAPFVVERGQGNNGGNDTGSLEIHHFEGGDFTDGTPFVLAADDGTAPDRPAWLHIHGSYGGATVHSAMADVKVAGSWLGRASIRPPWTGYDESTQLAIGAGAAGITAY